MDSQSSGLGEPLVSRARLYSESDDLQWTAPAKRVIIRASDMYRPPTSLPLAPSWLVPESDHHEAIAHYASWQQYQEHVCPVRMLMTALPCTRCVACLERHALVATNQCGSCGYLRPLSQFETTVL